jgi:hypothetical protein
MYMGLHAGYLVELEGGRQQLDAGQAAHVLQQLEQRLRAVTELADLPCGVWCVVWGVGCVQGGVKNGDVSGGRRGDRYCVRAGRRDRVWSAGQPSDRVRVGQQGGGGGEKTVR